MKIYFESPESWAWIQVLAMLASAAMVYGIAKLTGKKESEHE